MPSYFEGLFDTEAKQQEFFDKLAEEIEKKNAEKRDFVKNRLVSSFQKLIKHIEECGAYDSDSDSLMPSKDFCLLCEVIFEILQKYQYEDYKLGFPNQCVSIKCFDIPIKFRVVIGQGTLFQAYRDPNPTKQLIFEDLKFLDFYIFSNSQFVHA